MTNNLNIERNKVVKYMTEQLLGPSNGEDEKVFSDKPHMKYLVGTLFPENSEQTQIDDGNNDASNTASDSDTVDDSPMDAVFQRLPASIGLSFYMENTASIEISVWGAVYEKGSKAHNNKSGESEKKSKPFWERKPIASKINPEIITINENDKEKLVLSGKAKIYCTWRQYGKGSLVTVNLINNAKISPEDKVNTDDCLFQVGFKCQPTSGKIKKYPNVAQLSTDEEEEELELQYMDSIQYAIGHGCSASWDRNLDKSYYVQTEWIPQHIIKNFKFDVNFGIEKNKNFLSLNYLSNKNTKKDDLINSLNVFLQGYKIWFENLKTQKTHPEFKKAKSRILKKIDTAIIRMQEGINLLDTDKKVFKSFKLANEAMLRQMVYSNIIKNNGEVAKEKIQPDFYSDDYKDIAWRPFQLAFQILVIESQVNIDSNYRDTVDLIWFPTGGGKTESYLALSAFELIYRRIKFGERGFGTGVIKRYTLRLLTTQQFQRTATLICAMDIMRHEYIDILYSEPFSLGLWVGQQTTPNAYTEPKYGSGALEQYNESLDEQEPNNHFQLLNCPVCGTRIIPKSREDDSKKYGIKATESSFKFFCPSSNCDLHDKIPVSVVDADIYKNPPSFLIGTIDKFARLAWDGDAASLFGSTSTMPPYLIIQDELHLISGPLGTIAGLYEAAISTVIKSKELIEPKYIAATATIRRSAQQIQSLYGKKVNIFPPPGISSKDSYFAQVDIETSGRLYVGIMSQGQNSPITSLINVSATLSQSVYDSDLKDKELKDAYWTQIIYHNSKRELGKTITLCNDDIPSKINTMIVKDEKYKRKLKNIEELSGSKVGYEIPRILERLNVQNDDDQNMIDILPCTNMISVGVDVPRLGLMLINGQPKTTAEYIQASSRIGRSDRRPGIVVTHYSPTKPRDRSHYENFISYHDSIYRYVEPTSVTPFSPPAMERALHAALVIVMRQTGELLANDSADLFDPNKKEQKIIIDLFLKRIIEGANKEQSTAKKYLDKIINDWSDIIEESREQNIPLLFDSTKSKQKNSLLIRFDKQIEEDDTFKSWRTLNSMRNVDAESRITIQFGKYTGKK